VKHHAARGEPSTLGPWLARRRKRVWRALLLGRPIDDADRDFAIQLAEENDERLKTGAVRGLAFLTMGACALWNLHPGPTGEVILVAASVVAPAVYLVGLAYALRVRRWLRRNAPERPPTA